jgi:hypothetical protein
VLRLARGEARKGSGVAKTFRGFAFVAVAILIVTAGALCTESRVAARRQNTSSWHTSKTSRMTVSGADELAPVKSEQAESAIPVISPEFKPDLPPIESPLPELTGAPQAHGLRAPPKA